MKWLDILGVSGGPISFQSIFYKTERRRFLQQRGQSEGVLQRPSTPLFYGYRIGKRASDGSTATRMAGYQESPVVLWRHYSTFWKSLQLQKISRSRTERKNNRNRNSIVGVASPPFCGGSHITLSH